MKGFSRGALAATALVLSVLVGFVTPLGDAAPALASIENDSIDDANGSQDPVDEATAGSLGADLDGLADGGAGEEGLSGGDTAGVGSDSSGQGEEYAPGDGESPGTGSLGSGEATVGADQGTEKSKSESETDDAKSGEDLDADDLGLAQEKESLDTEEPETQELESANSLLLPDGMITPFAAGDSTTPNAYFSLRQAGTPGGSGDDRGTISAIIDKYVVNPTGPALTPQSGGHPTLSVSVPLEGDRQADSMPANPGNGVTRYQYRVGQAALNANSLGIAQNGDAYFTVQFVEERRSQGSVCSGWLCLLGIGTWSWATTWSGWSEESTRYLSIWRVNLETGTITQPVVRITGYSANLTGGSVNSAGVFFFSHITNFTTPTNSMRFFIYRLNGSAVEQASTATTVANSRPTSDTAFSGDIAFDGYDNLRVLVGGTGTVSRMAMLTPAQVPATGPAANPTGIAVATINQTAPGAGMEPAGLAFPFTTYSVWQAASAHYLRNMTSLDTVVSSQNYSSYPDQRDLASIVHRPKFQLRLVVLGGLAKPTDRFTLSATPAPSTAVTRSTPSGSTDYTVADDWIDVTRPLSSNNLTTTAFPFSVTAMTGTGTVLADYLQQWSCVETTSGTPSGTGTSTSGTVSVSVIGNPRMECTVTLTRATPDLKVSKRAYTGFPAVELAHDEPVTAATQIEYRLLFDNSGGTAAATGIDYIDYLADVLDDATFNDASLAVTGTGPGPASTLTAVRSGDRIEIAGEVPAGATRTVSFTVTVLSDATNVDARIAGAAATGTAPAVRGYRLNNYLAPSDGPVPGSTCDAPGAGQLPECTSNPIPAWTFNKISTPTDGQPLNRGGNVHYGLIAGKLNAASTIEDLVFADDLTHVFKTAGWAPDAAVPFGALERGVYFIDASGNTLDRFGAPNGGTTTLNPVPAYEAVDTLPEQDLALGKMFIMPVFDTIVTGRWILQTAPIDVPAAAVTAELWFAVEAGQNPVGIPANSAWSGANEPQNGWQFINYALGSAATQPLQCSLDLAFASSPGLPDVDRSPENHDPANSYPPQCRNTHELNAGFFTIRKDAAGLGLDLPWDTSFGSDTSGLWNMVGHEFVVHDDDGGAPSTFPSQYLCRAEYDPNQAGGWDGVFSYGGSNADNGTPDWGVGWNQQTGQYTDTNLGASATLDAIKAWNQANPADVKPLCAIFYPQPEGGPNPGRYRGDNFQPVLALAELPGVARDFWLVETKAPTAQMNLAGTAARAVTGVQLLAQPIAFRIWPYGDGTHIGGPSWHGKRQLDVAYGSGWEDRCSPGDNVGSRPVACVNPTGYLMIIKDAVPLPLPLTGGAGTISLMVGGASILAAVLGGVWWWRRRQAHAAAEPPRAAGGEPM